MAELKPFEVIMRLSPYAAQNKNEICFHAEKVTGLVRCKDCKYRIVNEHYGEKGYLPLKAECDLDTGDPFSLGRRAEEDDWFCADGERKEGDNT